LPDFGAREYLLTHQMEKEDHTLTAHDFKEIAKSTHNFSGSDINGLVKNACYEPLRRFQKAKYFKQVGTNSHGKPVYMSCSPSEPGAEAINKEQLSGDQVRKNKIGVEDFYKALTTSKTSVGDEDLKKYVDWTKDFGVEG
jgi:vacuolar protein-sorting-associated protein 4